MIPVTIFSSVINVTFEIKNSRAGAVFLNRIDHDFLPYNIRVNKYVGALGIGRKNLRRFVHVARC
jgi:hypothetical protein